MEQVKKVTKGQLEKRLNNAILHIDKTKDTKEVYFSDRGIRIVISDERATISQGGFSLVFDEYVAGGASRNYVVLSAIVDMAHKYDCIAKDKDGNKYYSFWKLSEVIPQSNEATKDVDKDIITKFTVWYEQIITTMFLIHERADFTYLLGAKYALSTIASGVVTKPYDKDMTNKDLMNEIIKCMQEYNDNTKEEFVVIKKESEEEHKQEVAKAMEENLYDKFLKEESNNE